MTKLTEKISELINTKSKDNNLQYLEIKKLERFYENAIKNGLSTRPKFHILNVLEMEMVYLSKKY